MEVSRWFKTVPSFLVERSWRGVVTRDSVLPAGHGGHIRPEMGTEGQIHVCGGSSCRRHMFTDQRLWRILTSQSRSEKRKRQKAGDLEAEGGKKKEEVVTEKPQHRGREAAPGGSRVERKRGHGGPKFVSLSPEAKMAEERREITIESSAARDAGSGGGSH